MQSMSVGLAVKPGADTRHPSLDISNKTAVEATVHCLARYGYAGTTLDAVAEMANFDSGTQLPFADRMAMMRAAWEYLADSRHHFYETSANRSMPLRQRMDCTITAALERAGNDDNLASLELKMATRGDADLREMLQDKIVSREQEIDRHWVELFSDTNMPKQDLIAARHMIVAMCRGLSIERINQTCPTIIIRMEADIRRTAHTLIVDRSRAVVPN